MTFKIVRNDAGNCINFEGSTNPSYFNACLSGEVAGSGSNLVNVVNDIRTGQTGTTQYEFFHIPYTEFVDANGSGFADAQAAADYITVNGNVTGPSDINTGYKGVYNASTNVPDTGVLGDVNNGDWYWVTESGNGLSINDQIRYNVATSGWDVVENVNVAVSDIQNGSLASYDIYCRADYSGFEQAGSTIRPYNNIQTALDNAADGDNIFIDGEFTISSALTLPSGKDVHIHGQEGTIIKYASFNAANGAIIKSTSSAGKEISLRTIEFKNAGEHAVDVSGALHVKIRDCVFTNNGWTGDRLDFIEAETDVWASGGTLGYNSTSGDLASFYASECSEGGAVKIQDIVKVEITDCEIYKNNIGVVATDCGFTGSTEGFGYLARNQIYNNVGGGIALESSEADGSAGCRNFTVYNNNISNHGDHGFRSEGGLNNTISLGLIKNNWCAGIELTSTSNMRVRDLDLSDNNRSATLAKGVAGHSLSTIQLDGSYLDPEATFIAEIMNVQIHNTHVGAGTVRCGLLLKEDLENHTSPHAIVNIDNVGFIDQDYALDFECDLNPPLFVSVGDCKYINSAIKNVRLQGAGNYYEVPFSNQHTTIPSIDIETEANSQSILVKDGQDGDVLNRYHLYQLQADIDTAGNIIIRERGTSKIQFSGLQQGYVYINGSLVAGSDNDVVNALNAKFTEASDVIPGGTNSSLASPSGTLITPNSSSYIFDPVGDADYASNSTGANHGAIWSTETIDEIGEYFTMDIQNKGIIGFGIYDLAASGTDSIGDIEHIGEGVGNQHRGLKWSLWFHPTPNGPWTLYGETTSYSIREGWSGSNTQRRFSTSVEGGHWGSGNPVRIKVGIDPAGYVEAAYYNRDLDEYITMARSSYLLPEGDYGFAAKWNATAPVAYQPRVHLNPSTAPTGLQLNWKYIQSPDSSFYYPLFATEQEADYADENITTFLSGVAGLSDGSGTSHAHVFVDDPTNTTWYMPDSAQQHDVTYSPISTSGVNNGWNPSNISWTEIATESDTLHAPASLGIPNATHTENVSVNIQIVPADYTNSVEVAGLPDGLSYSAGFITGTTPYVPEETEYTINTTISNDYGSTVDTWTLTITDNASLSTLSDITTTYGNTIQPNRIKLSHDFIGQYNTVLPSGSEIRYSYGAGAIPPTIGILNASGQADLDSFSSASGDILGQGNYNFGQTNKWDLRYVSFGGYIGHSDTKFNLVGWSDNATQTGTEGDNFNIEFKLVYDTDGYIKLYRGDVLKLTSASTFSGDQTITLAGFDDQQQTDVYVPANFTIVNSSFGSTVPPSGFVNPLLQGQMATSTLLGEGPDEDAAVQISDTLGINFRYIFPQTWVEANVLPYMTEGSNEVFFGIPESGAIWTDVGPSDWDAGVRLEGQSRARHDSKLMSSGVSVDTVVVNSETDAYYDYAVEWDGDDLHVIACNVNDINTQPGINNGGSFSRTTTLSSYSGGDTLDLAIGVDGGGQVNLSTVGLQKIRIPFGPRDILCGEASGGGGRYEIQPAASSFDSTGQHAPNSYSYDGFTINAGYTYRFIYHPSMEAGDYIEFRLASDNTTVYSSGITTFDNTSDGDPKATEGYKGLTFAVPSDAPPLRLYHYNSYQSGSFDSGREIAIAGSTYVEPVTGITLEGPSANQTGTNLFDTGDHGWLSVDEQLGAGERLVMDTAFLADLVDAMPDNGSAIIGVKDGSWASSSSDFFAGFEGGLSLAITRYSTTVVRIQIARNDVTYTASPTYYTTLANITSQNVAAFLEITSSGNNIRGGFRADNITGTNDVSSTAYADWNSSYKLQTGDQGYGLTSVDIMILGDAQPSNAAGMDTADVTWSGLSEISVPTPAATLTTNWTKALDFSGSAERTQQVANNSNYCPIMMGGQSTTVAGNLNTSRTVSASAGRPWATAIVFNSDGNASNQHIWNLGEGAGSTDDNIYVRVTAQSQVYFGWGRDGALNECFLGNISSGSWYGLYIAHTGERLSGANATSNNLADCFDIRWVTLSNGTVHNDLSTASNWTSTGGRMDRQFVGAMTIGGRGANRNFHGKVAAMVVTTLSLNVDMPGTSEISMMVRDPMQWVQDYRVGTNTWRLPWQGTNAGFNFAINDGSASYATQIWLMGDGTNDAYAQIRNQVFPNTQNYTPMNMISMSSNDIQTVTISGLT